MKKQHSKRKKVVIDAIDGKIINEPIAIKIENIEEYLEKNGIKVLKILVVFAMLSMLSNFTYAYDASYMTQLDLSILSNVYMLIAIIAFSVVLILLGIKNSNFITLVLGSIILLFSGLVLLANGFNVILSILICLVALILIWLGA